MALNPVTHHDDLSQISPVATLGTISSCRKVSENCPSFEDVWHKGKISVFNYSVSHVAQIASNIKVARF